MSRVTLISLAHSGVTPPSQHFHSQSGSSRVCDHGIQVKNMKMISNLCFTILTSAVIITISVAQFPHRQYPHHKVRYRRNNQVIPRILNRNSEILSLGHTSNRRVDSSTFTPSKSVEFNLEFTHIDDVETEETQKKPVVFKTDKLSNPLQFKSSKSSGMVKFLYILNPK